MASPLRLLFFVLESGVDIHNQCGAYRRPGLVQRIGCGISRCGCGVSGIGRREPRWAVVCSCRGRGRRQQRRLCCRQRVLR